MSWNGLGTYVLPPAYSPEVNGQVIDAVRYNGLTSDVATGITNCLNKNGENTPTADISWGNFRLKLLGQPTTLGDALAWGKNAQLGGTGDILRNTTTTARGSGQNFVTFYDPTGQKGYIGYGGTIDDNFTVTNLMNAPVAFLTNSVERMRVMAGGAVVVGGTTNVGVGGGTDTFAVSAAGIGLGIAGSTITAQINVQASGFFEIVNRTAGGGLKLYTNAGGVVAAQFASNGDLTMPGNTFAKGVALVVGKSVTTGRTAASLTDDPDFLIAIPGAGTYAVDLYAAHDLNASAGSSGLQARINFSGTLNAVSHFTTLTHNSASNAFNAKQISTGTFSYASGSTSTFPNGYIKISGILIATGAGNLSLQWGQNTASGGITNIGAGYLSATRVA